MQYCISKGPVYINPIIYGEVSVRFETEAELEEILMRARFQKDPIPYKAAFLAGKCFQKYRKRGGVKTSPLPDFLIGAHATVHGWTLLTRDAQRYQTYFPELSILSPAQQ